MFEGYNATVRNPDYNLDYDLFVIDPVNPDTTDPQRVDCIHDALKRLDTFVKKQVLANQRLVVENQRLQQEINRMRNEMYARR